MFWLFALWSVRLCTLGSVLRAFPLTLNRFYTNFFGCKDNLIFY